MPSHLLCRGVPSPQAFLPFVFVASWGCSGGTNGSWFLVFILIDIPAVTWDAEHLVLWWRFGSFFFFFHEWCEENLPVTVGFLKPGCVWHLFQRFLPQDVSWGQLSLTDPNAWEIDGPVNPGGAIVVTQSVHKVAALPLAASGSLGNQSLRATWLPGLWIGVDGVCLSNNLRSCVSLLVLKLHPLEKEMATHSSILAWKNPWIEESGGLKSMGLHDWACVHEGGGRWVGSNKLVELKTKQNKTKQKNFPPPLQIHSNWATAPCWGGLGGCTLKKEVRVGDLSTRGPGG